MSVTPHLAATGLGRHFGTRVALKDVTLSLRGGEILALFGPNGAGKTTLLRILATLLRPSRGQVFLDGLDLCSRSQRSLVRQRIGFLAHRPMLYERLNARENLVFFAEIYGVRDAWDRATQLLKQVGLSGREEDQVRHYSRGMQQRLAIARGLVHDPDLLLLDEPFSGLDPSASDFLSHLLREQASRGRIILLTTHNLEAGYRICHRAAVLNRGRIELDRQREETSPEELSAALQHA